MTTTTSSGTPTNYDLTNLKGLSAGNGDGLLTRDEINDAYRNLFGRDAATQGLDYWGTRAAVHEGNLYASLLAGASEPDKLAAQNTMNNYLIDGSFKTPVSHTWADPTVKKEALEKYSVGNQLDWNTSTNRWEYAAPAAPAPAPALPAPAPSTQYAPNYSRQVTDPEVVEKRIAAMMRDGHPLLEQARQQALEQFSSRGLLNSSMAMQAAQEAMLAQAFQIASQDADTFNRQGLANQGFQNEFAGREQSQNYAKENQYNDYRYKGSLMDREYEQRGGLLDRELAAREKYEESAASRNELTDARGRYTTSMSQLQRDYQDEYARLTQNPDISPEEQTKFIDNLNTRYKLMYEDISEIYAATPNWEAAWSVAWGAAPGDGAAPAEG